MTTHGADPAISRALTALRGPGCPACRAAEESETRFFAWFMVETYGEPPMVERLRGSLGLCPPHTRRLLRDTPHPGVPTFVYQQVVGAALRHLADRRPRALRGCPACESVGFAVRHVLHTLTHLLPHPKVAAAYEESGGLCLPHLLEALPRAGPGHTQSLVLTVLRALTRAARTGAGPAARAVVAGCDPDARDRARLRAVLPCGSTTPSADHPTLSLLRQRFRVPACPLCLVVGRMERRYLDWLAREASTADRGPDVAASLCPRHLHDLLELGPGLVARVVPRVASVWIGALARFQGRLAALPSPRLPDRLRSLPASLRRATEGGARRPAPVVRGALRALVPPRSRYREAVAQLRQTVPPCPACSALATTERREVELLLAALADPPTARRFESSHGLCLRHATALSQWPPVVRDLLTARLRVVAWELEEASRKQGWSFRHEPAGPEASAWLRAPALVDGRVFVGGPPSLPG